MMWLSSVADQPLTDCSSGGSLVPFIDVQIAAENQRLAGATRMTSSAGEPRRSNGFAPEGGPAGSLLNRPDLDVSNARAIDAPRLFMTEPSRERDRAQSCRLRPKDRPRIRRRTEVEVEAPESSAGELFQIPIRTDVRFRSAR